MSFKNSKYFNSITIQSVDNAISAVNKLSDVRITYFWHSPSASRIVRQNIFSVVNKGINKPDSAFQVITSYEILNLSQIFTGFS